MRVHQIIYTSCKRGIRGVNDGQQVFSHDAAFPEGAMEQVKGMFTHIIPALEPGVVMTEELAATMPQAFCYRRLSSGYCAVALNTYLGRDYMGSAGRFGNQLSHVLLFDPEDTELYPCQLYGSEALRSRMAFEEVNSPDQPDFLPTPKLTPGYGIDPETVTEFLAEDGRMEVYQNMLWAMLAFSSHRKRVVICDEPENIIFWIAALQFALPRKTALGINFTTYEYDPALSESQVCGVVPRGTRFDEESAQRHFTFNLLTGDCPDFPKEPEFFDFMDTAMSFSYDSIQDFHLFLESVGYDQADEGIYDAYALYALMSDGPEGVSEQAVGRALGFAREHGDGSVQKKLLDMLLNYANSILHASPNTFFLTSEYIAQCAQLLSQEQRQTVRDLMVDRLLYGCMDESYAEQVFGENFKQVEAVCQSCSIGLPSALMAPRNRDKLLGVLDRATELWKVRAILRILREYVREQQFGPEVLEYGGQVGAIYTDLVTAKVNQSMEEGLTLARELLDDYADQPVHMAMLMVCFDQAMTATGLAQELRGWLWTEFYGMVCALKQTAPVWRVLAKQDMGTRCMALYIRALELSPTAGEMARIYGDMATLIRQCPGLDTLTGEVARQYNQRLLTCSQRERYPHQLDLFLQATSSGEPVLLTPRELYDLEKELLIPLVPGKLDSEARNLCQQMYKYNVAVSLKIPKKLVLLQMGMVFAACRRERELFSGLEGILHAAGREKLDLTEMSSQTAWDYLDWITPGYTEVCRGYDAMEQVFRLHAMSREQTERFFLDALQDYMKDSKRDNRALVDFLGVCLERGGYELIRELTKMVRKLNKNRQEELDAAMADAWSTEKSLIALWQDILQEAQAPNPFQEKVAGLFRRKSKDKE